MKTCKEHDLVFPCAECERIRQFSFKVLCVAAAMCMVTTLLVLWVYEIMDPPELRVVTTCELGLFLGILWVLNGKRH